MTDTSNNALVVAAQAGDENAFTQLVTKHYGMVHGLVYSKVNDWSVAEDVTQDVFTIAFTHLETLKHPEAFLMWLRQIARNSALNWVRTQSYRRKLLERHNQVDTKKGVLAEDPSGDAARMECRAQLEEAMTTLSDKLRDAMVLYYFEGQTVSECAEALGITIDTMKKRLRLGRARLHRYYTRRAQDDLEQLLPHQPQRTVPVERIMAGLVMGPAMPELGATAAKIGPGMVVNDLLHGASPSAIKDGAGAVLHGSITTAKTATVATAVSATAAAAGAVLVFSPLSGEPPVNAAGESSAMAITTDSGAMIVEDDGELAEGYGREIAVEDLFNGPPRPETGLQAGDRIVRINGQRLAASVTDDPRAVLLPTPGATVHVTVLRGGDEVDVTFVLPRLPHLFDEDVNQ